MGGNLVGELQQVVCAGIQGQRKLDALSRRHRPQTAFKFGICTLVNAGEQLHFFLCITAFYPKPF